VALFISMRLFNLIRTAFSIPLDIRFRTTVRTKRSNFFHSPQVLYRTGLVLLICCAEILPMRAQSVWDDFEGQGTINSWYGDQCSMVVG